MYIPLVSVSLRKPLINRKILERGELKQNLRNGVINLNQFYSIARGIQISWELEFRFHNFIIFNHISTALFLLKCFSRWIFTDISLFKSEGPSMGEVRRNFFINPWTDGPGNLDFKAPFPVFLKRIVSQITHTIPLRKKTKNLFMQERCKEPLLQNFKL